MQSGWETWNYPSEGTGKLKYQFSNSSSFAKDCSWGTNCIMREALSLKWQDHATENMCHHEYQGDMGRTSIICSKYIVSDWKEERDGREKDLKKKKKKILFLRVKRYCHVDIPKILGFKRDRNIFLSCHTRISWSICGSSPYGHSEATTMTVLQYSICGFQGHFENHLFGQEKE